MKKLFKGMVKKVKETKVYEKVCGAIGTIGATVSIAIHNPGLCATEAGAAANKVIEFIFGIAMAGGFVMAAYGVSLLVKAAIPSDEGGTNTGNITKGLTIVLMGIVLIFARTLVESLTGRTATVDF